MAPGTMDPMAPATSIGAVSTLKRQLAEEHQRPAWRIDILQDGRWLPSNATVDAHGPLQMAFRQSEKRSISIDAKLVNEISCDSLRESYIQNLREDLGLFGRTFYQEIGLTVTDWGSGMPRAITALLVEFLTSRRDDPNIPCLVHLDLHGQLGEVLEAMMRNREYYESMGSSLETLELSLQVDGQALVLPLFPNLIALRMYKPEFPARGMTDYSIRLLNLNCRSLQDVALVGDDAKIFAKVLAILAGEAFDRDRGSCLWLVGRLEVLLTALRSLGDLLEKLRSAERANFLTRLGKLNIHVDDAGNEGFGTIRTIASAALNRGLDEQQIAQRPKVLTTIRSMRPALRPNDTLMCLFDVTALSLGVATSRGTQLVEDEAELQRLRGALLTLRIHGEEELQVECSTLGGAVVLSLELPAQSTVADLEERMNSYSHVSQQSRLMNCDTLVVKEEKDALMTCLIQRNTTVPTRKSKVFTVASPGQQSVWLQILEGELPFAKDNHVVGQLRLDGLQPAAGMGDRPLVEVGFDLDANDVLHVTAADLGSGASSKASFPFDARWRVHPQDLERAVQRAEQVWKVKSTIQDRSDLFDHCCQALRQQRGDDAETTELLKMMAVVDEADIADDVDYKAQLQALVATQNHTAAIEDLD